MSSEGPCDPLIVGVGASAGGVEALQAMFSAAPADPRLAFVVMMHQSEGATTLLPQLLDKCTPMSVNTVTDGQEIVGGTVSIAPPGKFLEILNGKLEVLSPATGPGHALPIDSFFSALAVDQRNRCAVVVLSGTGSDGSIGVQQVASEAGLTLVQTPASAKFGGMPLSAIATNCVSDVLDPEEMPARLARCAESPLQAVGSASDVEQFITTDQLQKILTLVRSRTRHDFTNYKENTVRRRIDRRMRVHGLENGSHYARYLDEHREEVDLLFEELLIGVTSFFRDREVFGVLADALEPALSLRSHDDPVRVWVPGCATGEEAYTIAVCVRERFAKLDQRVEAQIFATDIDPDAIRIARRGRYASGVAEQIGDRLLKRYFDSKDDTVQVGRELRDMVVFAEHDVLRDPPFTRMDLISCRNLLIYLNPDAQKKLLTNLQYALRPRGLLLLGTSESLGGASSLFATMESKHKLFRRVGDQQRPATVATTENAARYDRPRAAHPKFEAGMSTLTTTIQRLLLAKFAPSAVIVTRDGEIVHVHGRTGKWFEMASGEPKQNALAMAREGLRSELAAGLRQAATGDETVVRESVTVQTDGGCARLRLTIGPLGRTDTLKSLFLVTLEEHADEAHDDAPMEPPQVDDRITQLERELGLTKETLHHTIEELEASNEELKSTNEELQSTNEELQSTNEELETSKEELQSLNEELRTVNSELEIGMNELFTLRDDMNNLLNSIEIATIFLDDELRITRFTDDATKIYKLIPTDVGRPIDDIVSLLDDQGVSNHAAEVLRTLVFFEKEVRVRNGSSYLLRIIPYRTSRNLISGVVLTFVDIEPIQRARQESRMLSTVIREFEDAVTVQDLQGNVLAWNRGAERLYGYSESEIIGNSILRIVPKGGETEVRDLLGRLTLGQNIDAHETRRVDKQGEIVQVVVAMRCLTGEDGETRAFSTIERAAVSDRHVGPDS